MKPYILLAFTILSNLALHGQDLSLEEKVGQILMVHFKGETMNEDALEMIHDLHVGGIIYYNWANKLSDPLQVKHLSEELQTAALNTKAQIPLFIAADQEGGLVARLENGFTIFPGNRALGETNRIDLAKQAAQIMGIELRSVGINFNLSPVVDVNSNPRNPVIGIRSFGKDPERVIAFGRSVLAGYEDAGILTSLKHFPGHGDVEIDSHEALPIVRKNLEELERLDLAPFSVLAPFADAVVTAHILVKALDNENCVTLSSKALGYLREKIGFKGLILSDSLVMEGLLEVCQNVEELALRAFNAGCDVLVLGGKQLTSHREYFELTPSDIKRIHAYLVDAVKEGRISLQRLDESVNRIILLKEKKLRQSQQAHFEIKYDSKAIAEEIARLAVRKTLESSFHLTRAEPFAVIAPELIRQTMVKSSFSSLNRAELIFFEGLNPSPITIESHQTRLKEKNVVIFFTYNAWKFPSQNFWIQKLLGDGKQVVVVCLRDPLDAELFDTAKGVITTFSPSLPSLEAVYQILVKDP